MQKASCNLICLSITWTLSLFTVINLQELRGADGSNLNPVSMSQPHSPKFRERATRKLSQLNYCFNSKFSLSQTCGKLYKLISTIGGQGQLF